MYKYQIGLCTPFYFKTLANQPPAKSFPVNETATFTEIAAKVGLDEPNLKRLLRHAMTNRIFKEVKPVVVAHTAISKVLAERSGFVVPRFLIAPPGALRIPGQLPFPMVVKPRYGDASEGISSAALVTTGRRLAERIEYLRREGCEDIICEEYIRGREFFVGVVHDRIVHPKEFIFRNGSRGAPRLATASFKFDAGYRKRWGIHAVSPQLSNELLNKLSQLVRRTSVALKIRDYGRFDLKLTPDDEWVFLEANPNTGLAPPGKNWMGTWDGVDYEAMISAILRGAMARHKRTSC